MDAVAKDDNDDLGFVQTVASFVQQEYLRVKVDAEKDIHILEKSHKNALPILELEDGKTWLSEPLSMARFLASDKLDFYGPDPVHRAKVD